MNNAIAKKSVKDKAKKSGARIRASLRLLHVQCVPKPTKTCIIWLQPQWG